MKVPLALLAFVCSASAQSTGTLRVKVIGTDQRPTAHATVHVDRDSGETDAEGLLSFVVKEGLHVVSAELADVDSVLHGMAVEPLMPQYVFVRGGTELPYEIHFRMIPRYSVRGIVTDSNGKPLSNANIHLAKPRQQRPAIFEQRSPGSSSSSSGVFLPNEPVDTVKCGAHGEFEFSVPSGFWLFEAQVGSSAETLMRGSAVVSVSRDTRDLVIRLARSFALEAAFEWVGKSDLAETFRNGTATLVWLDAPRVEYDPVDLLLEQGQRPVRLYGGRYLIRVWPPGAPGFYPASVLLGNREVMDREFTLDADSPRLRIIYRQGAGTVRAAIEPGVQATLVLYPRVRSDGQIIRTSQCSPDGTCELPNVAPGDYNAVAFRSVPRSYILAETALIDAVVPSGVPVHISEGLTITLPLPLVHWPQ